MCGRTDLLEWRGVSVRRDGVVVVQGASLRLDRPGPLWIVGPGGAGKSSLLAALGGETQDGRIRMSGECLWNGRELHAPGNEIVFVPQCPHTASALRGSVAECMPRSAQAAQRHALVTQALARKATVYLVDEPTAGLDDEEARSTRARLLELSQRSMVIGVTHNRQDCLATGGTTALLAGGSVCEVAASDRFFSEPSTDAGRVYVQTGNCGIAVTSRPASGNGIWWIVPGLLCGMSRPGLLGDAADAYRELVERGVRSLLCLEERCTYPVEPLRDAGISLHRFAIPDMAPPGFAQAIDICRLAEPAIRANSGIAAHCRGGLGRTGTVLAAILIWFGDTAAAAVERVRAAQPRAIQSAAQQRFLHDFADRIRDWR